MSLTDVDSDLCDYPDGYRVISRLAADERPATMLLQWCLSACVTFLLGSFRSFSLGEPAVQVPSTSKLNVSLNASHTFAARRGTIILVEQTVEFRAILTRPEVAGRFRGNMYCRALA